MGAKSVLKTTHGSVCSLQEITAPCWNNTSRKISFAFSINTRDGNKNLQPVFLKNHWTWWHCHLEDEVDAGSDMLDWTWTPSDEFGLSDINDQRIRKSLESIVFSCFAKLNASE
ncbi:hypothetical protein BHM03_00029955 [Ensete ventricosum]|nr:hypothetical protein BHM03_00029955 [Ensete ventricosum]